MCLPREHVQYVVGALSALSFVLILVRRYIRSVEWRVGILLLALLSLSAGICIFAGYEFMAPPDVLIPLIVIELGAFGRIYDSYRTFRSISGTLRNVGNLYVYAGLVCLLSRFTEFPILLWGIPILLFAAGYFFLRRKKGVAGAVCKGLGVLVSVGFIALILYDVFEGTEPMRGAVGLKGRLLPEIIRPSISDQLSALNEKVIALEAEKVRLAEELGRVRSENRELEGRLAKESSVSAAVESKFVTLEKARAEADAALSRATAEKDELKAMLERERAARAETDAKLAELEKARVAAKESFTAIDEKLNLAAENLKKVVAERDELKAELESLKASVPATPAAPAEGIDVLRRQLAEKEKESAKATAEAAELRGMIQKARDALAITPPAAPTAQ